MGLVLTKFLKFGVFRPLRYYKFMSEFPSQGSGRQMLLWDRSSYQESSHLRVIVCSEPQALSPILHGCGSRPPSSSFYLGQMLAVLVLKYIHRLFSTNSPLLECGMDLVTFF